MPDCQGTLSSDLQADQRVMHGFTLESGAIVPVEVTVADITTDCRDVLHEGETVCWHKKYEDVFRDLCLTCDTKCEAYSLESRPAFARLVERKTMDPEDAERFMQRISATVRVLCEATETVPPMDCSNCGECCNSMAIDIYFAEYVRIREYLQRHFSASELIRIRGLSGMELALEKRGLNERRRCPLRDEERKICTINDVKPLVCRKYACEKIMAEGSLPCVVSAEHREKVSSASDPFFIIRDQEILIFKANDLNRWLLL